MVGPVLLIFALNRARKSSDRALVVGLSLFIAVMFALRFSLHHVAIVGDEAGQVGAIGYTDKDNPSLAGILYRIAGVRPDMIAYGAVLAFVYKALPNPLDERWRRLLGILGGIGCFVMSMPSLWQRA